MHFAVGCKFFLTHRLFGSFSHVRGVLTVVALGLLSSPRFCVSRGVQIRFGPLWNANLLAVFSSVHAGGLLILRLGLCTVAVVSLVWDVVAELFWPR